jgi:large subunit ribosomal protein L15
MHDFNLHAPAGANKRKRIVGRGQGSGLGTTSGKGNKGQQARSGGKTYAGFEGGQMPLYRRLAHRGFSNYPFRKEFQIINLEQLEKAFADSDTVDTAALIKKGMVKGTAPVKILGNGNLTKKLSLRVAAVSASAREKIEKAGGEVTVDAPKKSAPKKGAAKKKAGVSPADEGVNG